MIKQPLSLKLVVLLTLTAVAALLIAGYSLLSANYFVRGMDTIIRFDMKDSAYAYLHRHNITGQQLAEQPLQVKLDHFQLSSTWESQPEALRQAFGSQAPLELNTLLKAEENNGNGRTFLLQILPFEQHQRLYVSLTLQPRPANAPRHIPNNLLWLLLLAGLLLVVLAVLTLLFVRRIAKPAKALGNWARHLNAEQLQHTPPDFHYPELNELAHLIHTSLSSVQDSLLREHRFLRHASHELRTPIAVIRNNIELLHKLAERRPGEWEQQLAPIIDRVDRASLTMKHMTETLLWLSKDSAETLPLEHIDIAELVRQATDELHYLLKDKTVQLTLSTTPYHCQLPTVAAHIVIANLLRNAFQHTWQGHITIAQSGSTVRITNTMADDEGHDGFGLGIQLIEQLCSRLGWPYQHETQAGHYIAEVSFHH